MFVSVLFYIFVCVCVCVCSDVEFVITSVCVCVFFYMNVYVCVYELCVHVCMWCAMGGLHVVGSLKLYVSFAKEPYERDDILQKRPIILRSLLFVASP